MQSARLSSDNSEMGCIYVATGPRHIAEAVESARSFREAMSDIPIWLWCDRDPGCPDIFANVVVMDSASRSFADKIGPLSQSPFAKTIFLDTDTRVCCPLLDVFEILDRFDLAAVHPPMRVTMAQALPDAFPEINSGLLAFRLTPPVKELFARWKELYDRHVLETGRVDDQPPLRRALYESDVRICILPPEYNFRTILPGAVGRGPVRVIHGRHRNMRAIEDRLNRHEGCRVFLPGGEEFVPARFAFLQTLPSVLAAPFLWANAMLQQCKSLLTRARKKLG